MRIHTNHSASVLIEALRTAQEAGKVPSHVDFDRFESHRSNSRPNAFEVHLGTDTKLPGEKRRPPNSGSYGAGGNFAQWAATYDEWGWFLAALFDADPAAIVGNRKVYDGAEAFHAKTRDKYVQ